MSACWLGFRDVVDPTRLTANNDSMTSTLPNGYNKRSLPSSHSAHGPGRDFRWEHADRRLLQAWRGGYVRRTVGWRNNMGSTAVMRIYRCVLALVALVVTQIPSARAAEQVDLLLALAMDVSRSMDQAKFMLQRQGYAAAISNPQVLSSIRSGPHQKIAICFIDWSGPFEQKLVIDWNVIDGVGTALQFGDLIAGAPRSFYNSTSIGSGINFAIAQIARAPFEAERHAIDVSGDGTNNAGRDVQFFRDQAVAKGIIVNGIVILTDIQTAQNPQHTNPPGGI